MYLHLDRSKRCPFPLKPTETYLGENEFGYYTMDGFFDGLGNMFKRMVKFTPKSFTPGNLYKGFINTALTAATFGAYQILPKNIRKTVYDVGKIAIPVIAGGAAAYALGPSIMGYLGPKLSTASGMLGKGVSSVGRTLFDSLMKLPSSKQAQIAQAVTPKDIVQAEQTGKFPPHIQWMIEQAERQAYQPAAESVQALQRAQYAYPMAPVEEPTVGASGEGPSGGGVGLAVLALGALVALKR